MWMKRGVGRGEMKEVREEARDGEREGRREDGDERRHSEKDDLEDIHGKEREINGGPALSHEHGGSDLVNLFVRNVAKHVNDGQLVAPFRKVRFRFCKRVRSRCLGSHDGAGMPLTDAWIHWAQRREWGEGGRIVVAG